MTTMDDPHDRTAATVLLVTLCSPYEVDPEDLDRAVAVVLDEARVGGDPARWHAWAQAAHRALLAAGAEVAPTVTVRLADLAVRASNLLLLAGASDLPPNARTILLYEAESLERLRRGELPGPPPVLEPDDEEGPP